MQNILSLIQGHAVITLTLYLISALTLVLITKLKVEELLNPFNYKSDSRQSSMFLGLIGHLALSFIVLLVGTVIFKHFPTGFPVLLLFLAYITAISTSFEKTLFYSYMTAFALVSIWNLVIPAAIIAFAVAYTYGIKGENENLVYEPRNAKT